MKADQCKHYEGMGVDRKKGAKCKVGVVYLEVARPLSADDMAWHNENYPRSDPTWTGIYKRLPCHAENGLQANCAQYCEPTTEELAEQEKLWTKMFTNMMTTRKAIVDYCRLC